MYYKNINSSFENHNLKTYEANSQEELNNIIDTVSSRYTPSSTYEFFVFVRTENLTLEGGVWKIQGWHEAGGGYGVQTAQIYTIPNPTTKKRTLSNKIWKEWNKDVLNSDLYGVYNIGSNTAFANVLANRVNKITPFAFYYPSDNPFSFSMGYGIAFNHGMLHNNKMFTLMAFDKTGTQIEVKQFTIT